MMAERNSRRGESTDRGSRRGGRDDDDDSRGGRSSRGGRDTGRSSGRSSGSSSGYRYQARNPEAATRRSTAGGGDFDKILRDDIKMFKVNDGDNTIRIMPPTWDAPEHFGYDIHVHSGIGPDQQTYLCLDKMKGEPCPICDERKQAIADNDEEYADELKPVKRVLVALIDRDHEKDGPQVWAMPWGVDRDLCALVVDKKSGEVLPIDDPENGYDVEFTRTGTGIKTKYVGLQISRRESDLGNDKWLDFMVDNPLPDLLQFYSYDHIAKVFGGASGGGKSSRSSPKDELTEEQERDLAKVDTRGRRNPSRDDDDALTWDGIHGMTYKELCAVIDDNKLDIDPEDSKDDEDLADWICEEMKIKKEAAPARRSSSDESTNSRMANLRSRRQVD
jgi:hypothetical protein